MVSVKFVKLENKISRYENIGVIGELEALYLGKLIFDFEDTIGGSNALTRDLTARLAKLKKK